LSGNVLLPLRIVLRYRRVGYLPRLHRRRRLLFLRPLTLSVTVYSIISLLLSRTFPCLIDS